MTAADRRIEQDPVTSVAHPVAQLDVLDTRAREALVEAPELEKEAAADRPEAGPEGHRLPTRRLMEIGVREVPVLRHKPRIAGCLVIGAKNCRNFGSLLHEIADSGRDARR